MGVAGAFDTANVSTTSTGNNYKKQKTPKQIKTEMGSLQVKEEDFDENHVSK